jgi:hypothetical protein
MSRATKKISPDRWYSLQEIVSEKLIPWATSYWSIKKVVEQLKGNKGCHVVGKGTNVRYQIKGYLIEELIEGVASGKIAATTIKQEIWQHQQGR